VRRAAATTPAAILVCRRVSLPIAFLWVAAIVLAIDPLAPLQAGFWLSFGAVAILLAQFAPRIGRASWVRDFLMAQIVLGVAMLPLLLATIGNAAWVGPIANLVAVPLVSRIVIPLDLLLGLFVALVPHADGWRVHLVDSIVGFVVGYLRELERFDWIGGRSTRTSAGLLVSAAASALLLPLTWRRRLVLLPVLPAPSDLPNGEFQVRVLDVGQRLSVVVDTARHRLLYDAGPRFPSGFDLGSAVVVPVLRSDARAGLDAAILSQADMDHVGGYPSVAQALTVRALLGGEPVTGLPELRACRAGQGWQWDGVRCRVLHPSRMDSSDNDSSCVLLIDNGRRSTLLPGDITRSGEGS
jgi:competence protein ComEC